MAKSDLIILSTNYEQWSAVCKAWQSITFLNPQQSMDWWTETFEKKYLLKLCGAGVKFKSKKAMIIFLLEWG